MMFRHDCKYGFRVLFKKPVFTLTIAVTFGLGIGAKTAIFTFVNAILLEPVPFPDSSELVMAWVKRLGLRQSRVAAANYLDWRKDNQGFTSLETYRTWVVNLAASGEPERPWAPRFRWNSFDPGRAFCARPRVLASGGQGGGAGER